MSYLDTQKVQAANFRHKSILFRQGKLLAYNRALLDSEEFKAQAEKLDQLEKAEKRNQLRLSKLSRKFQAASDDKAARILSTAFGK